MENEAVFGAQSCPSRKRWRRCRRLALFFSSRLLRLLLSDHGRFCVVLCSSLCFFFFSSSSSLERAAREREKRARAKKSMHVNLEQKRRDVCCVFSVVAVDDFFLLLSLLRCVSFKRTKDQPTNTKEEALKVFLYMYIYITRGNESRCCVLRARVSLYSSS